MSETYAERAERVQRQVAELLFLEPGELGPHEDLFAAGLDSIRLMTLAEQWRAEGAAISFADLAERPTVAAWAELLT